MSVHVRVEVTVAPNVTKRLKVVPGHNWKGDPGWEWVCPPCPSHPWRQHRGFSHEDGFTVRLRLDAGNPLPSAQSRAMDGARRHLHRYHLDGAG